MYQVASGVWIKIDYQISRYEFTLYVFDVIYYYHLNFICTHTHTHTPLPTVTLHRPCTTFFDKDKSYFLFSAGMENGQVPTYEEAFPPLASPTSTTAPSSANVMFQAASGNQSAWPVRSIPSSSITQVKIFTVQ